MAVPQSVNRAATAHIDLELPLRRPTTEAVPAAIHRSVPKTRGTMPPFTSEPRRSGAISRAGHHRWPQATMLVMGGTECQVFDTEMLTVSTTNNETKRDLKSEKTIDGGFMEAKSMFPDIAGNNAHDFQAAEAKQEKTATQLQFPTKPGSLPRIQKGTAASEIRSFDVREEEKAKVVCNIKFWRGTTPCAKDVQQDNADDETKPYDKESLTSKKAEKQSTGHKNPLQNWSEQLSTLEEKSKKKYFSWHMALRERLLRHEKMRYHEAVTRISKYRQRLRQRPNIYATQKDMQFAQEVQAWRNILQRHEESKKRAVTTNDPSGVRMSPTKEWKPYILSQKEDQKQNKPPFFGKNTATSNESTKAASKKPSSVVTSSVATTRHQAQNKTSEPRSPKNYPVHGEGLLKMHKSDKKQALCNSANPDPRADDKKLAGSYSSGCHDETKQMDDKAQTLALLIDLKKQLKEPTGNVGTVRKLQKSAKRGRTAPHNNGAALSTKLKLLLQNSAKPQERTPVDETEHRSSAATRHSTRLKMRSESSQHRPLTRPRTYGEGTLPKINNLVTSLWQKSMMDEEKKVKHRLTLKGIAKRESHPSGVMAIAKKHIANKTAEAASTGGKISIAPDAQVAVDERQENAGDQSKYHFAGEQPMVKQLKVGRETTAEGRHHNRTQMYSGKVSKKQTAARRLHTTPYITSGKTSRNNQGTGQHASLQLINSVTNHQQMEESSNELEQGGKHLPRNKKIPAGKHKVLRIAVVEPPLTAGERHERQQQRGRGKRRLTFNPTHAAVANFTAAMLNSELSLRAPSSSPVDMFFRSLYNSSDELSTADLWSVQRADGRDSINERAPDKHRTSGRVSSEDVGQRVQINPVDGLQPLQHADDAALSHLYGIYNRLKIKTATAPKVKDLMDLQRLYRVMKKHGDAYVDGGVGYVYSASPINASATLHEPSSRQALHRRHANQKSLHKQPYYYYPYQVDGPADFNPADHLHSPLYLVTNADALNAKRHGNHHGKSTHKSSAVGQADGNMPSFQHLLDYQEPHESRQRWRKPLTKQEITVRMPKTPGIPMSASVPLTHLEQIQENVTT